MQVKKFEAPTMQEALKVIKRELGPDAIILSTKNIKSGFGLMSKASVEVTAAVADKDLHKKKLAEKGLPQNVKEKIWNSKAEKQSEIYDDYFEKQLKRVAKERVELSNRANAPAAAAPRASQQQRRAAPAVETQISARASAATSSTMAFSAPSAQPTVGGQIASAPRERRYIDIEDDEQVRRPAARAAATAPTASASANGHNGEMQREIEQLRNMVSELAAGAGASAAGSREEDGELTDELVRSLQDLVAAGIEKKFARQLVRSASFDLASLDRHDEQAIQERVAFHLMNDIQVGDLLESVGARAGRSESTVLALVGPTGVGKTTTIAKIASLGVLEKRLRVGLINLDSYKVAAADQLATYAKIMNVPFRSVTTRDELQQAVYDFSTLDLILIDTTGRSQKDQESLLQLRHMLAAVEGCRSVLMMSATTKDSDMNEVISRFKLFSPAGLVMSKLDETSVYGCIYNVQKRSGLPLLYFTVGQRVPEDIEKASAERVADLVLDL